ncbi:MAG TPA: phosphopantetheine-binding protein, partial [Vicinamibacteria bacterium]
KPIHNVRLHVLDPRLEEVPVGVVGELYIAGDGLAHGYLNRAELTAERFLEDVHRGRLYRTGDLVRWLPDGQLDYLGRADTQVKIRGFRVELGEIETLLMRHPAVREAVVLARGQGADKRLVAYVVTEDRIEQGPLLEELRRGLQSELPHYMLPSAVVVLDEMPLTANGKVNRALLPEPEDRRREAPAAPATETEARLARIWEDVLKRGPVGGGANFFELGGHSLLATRVISAVLEEFGCGLRIKDLFSYPSLAELARLIDALTAGAGAAGDGEGHNDEQLEKLEW